MNKMDLSSSLVFILVIIVSVDYRASQSALDDGTGVGTFGYGESLTIVSPNFPHNYPSNVNTQWLVSGPADYQIMAVFIIFHLKYNYDILRIGSGLDPDDTGSLLASLTGSSLPDIIVSKSNEMWLVFTSDGSVTALGFTLITEVYTPGNYTDYMTDSSSSIDFLDMSSIDSSDSVISSSAEDRDVYYADNTCLDESCFGDEETTICRCDGMCQFFGDCCPDYPLPIFNETPSNETLSNETLSSEALSNETLSDETLSYKNVLDIDVWECIFDTSLPQFYPRLGHGYRMIARCPSGWSSEEDVKRSCEQVPPNATIDVLYIYQDTYFRNLGCATCHGYEESSLTAVVISADQQCWWGDKYTLECMTPMPTLQSNTSMNTSGSGISMPAVQTIPKPRLCLVNTTGSCPNETNEEIASECQYYYKPFISEGIVSKHPACSYCNGGPLVICSPSIPSMDPVMSDTSNSLDYYAETDPTSSSLDYHSTLSHTSLNILQVFGAFRAAPSMPRRILCLQGFVLDGNGNCAPISSDWPICQSKHFEVKQSNGTVDCLKEIVPPPFLVKSSTDEINNTITFNLLNRDDMNPYLDIIQRDIIHQLQTPSRDDCKDMVISASQSCYVEDNPGNITYRCPEEMFAGYYLDFTPSLINNESLIFFNGTYIRPKWWSNIINMQFSNANVSSEYQFVVCGTEIALQTCSFLTVSNDSIEWDYQENQSVILYQGQMYSIEDILIHPDGSISICFIDQVTPIGKRTLMILAHVLFAISSVCLFATLITYIAFSTLRNRQGVCIMNFIVALFLGQILLQYIRLSVSQFRIPCIVVAALSHFFFLASFVWTTILAWDLSRTFTANKVKSFSSSSFGLKMVAFLVIGWGTPLVFVLITLVLQFGRFQNGPFLEYNSNTCWLAKLSSIVMFFVPMSVCLLSNLVFFIITVHGVHSTKKTTSMLKSGQDSQFKRWAAELRIYAKISALLGFAWIFGFLAMVIKVPFMDFLFIIAISLQGVFIFISFGTNIRVRKLWRTSIENSPFLSMSCTNTGAHD